MTNLVSKKNILDTIDRSIEVKQLLKENEILVDKIDKLINIVVNIFQNGNKTIFAGNGGSAADAQHLAAEFVSRFEFDRPGLPSLSLSTDTSMITAIGNDYGFERLFSRQLEAQGKEGDVFVGITTSGKSKNILNAFEVCCHKKIYSVALCGEGGDLENKANLVLRVPSSHTPRIQECHILIGHIICGEVERLIFQK